MVLPDAVLHQKVFGGRLKNDQAARILIEHPGMMLPEEKKRLFEFMAELLPLLYPERTIRDVANLKRALGRLYDYGLNPWNKPLSLVVDLGLATPQALNEYFAGNGRVRSWLYRISAGRWGVPKLPKQLVRLSKKICGDY